MVPLPTTYTIVSLQSPKSSLGWKISDNQVFQGRELCPQAPTTEGGTTSL